MDARLYSRMLFASSLIMFFWSCQTDNVQILYHAFVISKRPGIPGKRLKKGRACAHPLP
jgi:hypothetical protein